MTGDLLAILGVLFVTGGLAWIYPPLAPIFLGLYIMRLAVMVEKKLKGDDGGTTG